MSVGSLFRVLQNTDDSCTDGSSVCRAESSRRIGIIKRSGPLLKVEVQEPYAQTPYPGKERRLSVATESATGVTGLQSKKGPFTIEVQDKPFDSLDLRKLRISRFPLKAGTSSTSLSLVTSLPNFGQIIQVSPLTMTCHFGHGLTSDGMKRLTLACTAASMILA
jgi:hypothetical protein